MSVLFFSFSLVELLQQNPVRSAFTYELPNANVCSSFNPHALIFAISKSTNFASRDAIRRTWGQLQHLQSIKNFAHLRVKLLFLVDIDESRLISINLEQSVFHDLIQVRLPQHYTLSTHRDMAILHWTETYCPQALLTVKTDDDIFLNIYALALAFNSILRNVTDQPLATRCQDAGSPDPSAAIYGIKIRNARVIRNSNDPGLEGSRYIVTNDEYPCRRYPDYVSGFGYIVSRPARLKLLCVFMRLEKSFHMSDVYITGVLAEYLGLTRKHLPFQISSRATDNNCASFFEDPGAFVCASSSHYEVKSSVDGNPFQHFSLYWSQVNRNHHFYANARRLFWSEVVFEDTDMRPYPLKIVFKN